ncbi:hypothetical protein ACFQY0_13090 [Haloferula chungangensis]|uniref:EpsI family protein n=1 Tax=Haloferula chungangensis TaxID=1048331 RepID=A0ABW2L704_9BACT
MKTSGKIFFVIACLALAASEGVRLWWFSQDQSDPELRSYLKWTPPPHAVNQHFSETTGADVLNQDEGIQYLIENGDQSPSVEVLYLDYENGNPHVLADLGSHTPEVCFSASGAKLIEEFPIKELEVKQEKLYIRQWYFGNPLSDKTFYVFKIVWSPGATHYEEVFRHSESSPVPLGSKLRRAKLKAAQEGLNSPATRVILAMVRGTEDYELAWDAFKQVTIDRLEVAK